MRVKRFYDNLRKKEVPPKNITSLHCTKRDGEVDLVFYTEKYIKIPNRIGDYDKVPCNDFILEVE